MSSPIANAWDMRVYCHHFCCALLAVGQIIDPLPLAGKAPAQWGYSSSF